MEAFTYDFLDSVPVLKINDRVQLIKISSPLETWFDVFKLGKSKRKDIIKPYEDWFLENKDYRIKTLERYIRTFAGFESLQMDFSINSLSEIGKWLEISIKSEQMPEEEYERLRRLYPPEIDIEKWDLTDLSYSILYDVGVYFGESIIHHFPNLKWMQDISDSKLNVGVGHMVIQTKYKNCPMNPIWLVRILGYKLIEKKKDGNLLIELFNKNKELFEA